MHTCAVTYTRHIETQMGQKHAGKCSYYLISKPAPFMIHAPSTYRNKLEVAKTS